MKHPHALAVVSGQPALSPDQQRFNQLLAKLDKARADLLAWQAQTRHFELGHASLVAPLQAELMACQANMIRKMDSLLALAGERGAKRAPKGSAAPPGGQATALPKLKPAARATPSARERRRLGADICSLIAGLLEISDDAALADEMQALFQRHAGHSLDDEERDAVAAMKDLLESTVGLDLGDQNFDSEADLMRAARQKLEQAQASDTAARASAKRSRKRTAAERRQAQEAAEAAAATQSLREVYRKLAAAIHPDRADGDADRERRHALMQRANLAYSGKDLLALLALQLEIDQVDPSQQARMTAERARQYCRLLSDQLRELDLSLSRHRLDFCHRFGLETYTLPRLDQMGKLLTTEERHARSAVAAAHQNLRQLDDPAVAWPFLRRGWREEDQVDCPF